MVRYLAIIDHDEGRFGIWFPDAPGCVAMAESKEELIDNATEALSEWAAEVVKEGGHLPQPLALEQLLKSGEYVKSRGDLVAPIPLLPA